MAAVSTPLFVLSPVGLTFLLGEASVARQKKDPVRRAQRSVTVMSSLTHSTYLAGVIIPLVALGIPVSGVSAGPAGPLFNAPPVYDLGNNLHHRLQLPGFIAAVAVGALISVVISRTPLPSGVPGPRPGRRGCGAGPWCSRGSSEG